MLSGITPGSAARKTSSTARPSGCAPRSRSRRCCRPRNRWPRRDDPANRERRATRRGAGRTCDDPNEAVFPADFVLSSERQRAISRGSADELEVELRRCRGRPSGVPRAAATSPGRARCCSPSNSTMSTQPSSRSRPTTTCRASASSLGREDRGVAVTHRTGVDHHRGGQRVQRLDHPRVGERALDLLGERVGVLDAQGAAGSPGRSRAGWTRRPAPCPARWSEPTSPSAARLAPPLVALTTRSASRGHGGEGWSGTSTPVHSSRCAVSPGSRVPTTTSCPACCKAWAQRPPDHAGADDCDPHGLTLCPAPAGGSSVPLPRVAT